MLDYLLFPRFLGLQTRGKRDGIHSNLINFLQMIVVLLIMNEQRKLYLLTYDQQL